MARATAAAITPIFGRWNDLRMTTLLDGGSDDRTRCGRVGTTPLPARYRASVQRQAAVAAAAARATSAFPAVRIAAASATIVGCSAMLRE